MDKGDKLYCIKEFGRTVTMNYVGNTRIDPGVDEYWIDYYKGEFYEINAVYPESNLVTVWRPFRDAVKLGLPHNAKSDGKFYYDGRETEYVMNLWDYFVTEEEYKNMKRTKLIDEMTK